MFDLLSEREHHPVDRPIRTLDLNPDRMVVTQHGNGRVVYGEIHQVAVPIHVERLDEVVTQHNHVENLMNENRTTERFPVLLGDETHP